MPTPTVLPPDQYPAPENQVDARRGLWRRFQGVPGGRRIWAMHLDGHDSYTISGYIQPDGRLIDHKGRPVVPWNIHDFRDAMAGAPEIYPSEVAPHRRQHRKWI